MGHLLSQTPCNPVFPHRSLAVFRACALHLLLPEIGVRMSVVAMRRLCAIQPSMVKSEIVRHIETRVVGDIGRECRAVNTRSVAQ